MGIKVRNLKFRFGWMRSVLLAVLVLAGNAAFSQREENPTKQTPSVLLIPYMPAMHLSDADPEIAAASELQPEELRNRFREKLTEGLSAKIALSYDVRRPAHDFVAGQDEDLEAIYHTLYFIKDTVWPVKHPSRSHTDTVKISKKLFGNSTGGKKDKDRTYINVAFHDQLLFHDLSEKFSAGLFVFINEFDIKTDPNDLYDPVNQICYRSIRIHYSVFNREGKQVYGDVASVKFPVTMTDAEEIIKKNFPELEEQVKRGLQTVN